MVIISFVFVTIAWGWIFSGQRAEAGLLGSNSQTIGLAIGSTNPAASTGGSEIMVTDDGALIPEATAEGISNQAKSSDQISLYVVREGDSLSQIAEMFGVSVNTIAWANDFERGATIQPGQRLIILPISGVQHTVQTGETVKSIANKYKGDAAVDEILAEIIQYNGLDEAGTIAKGDIIIIPGGEEVRVAVSGGASGKSSSVPSYVGYFMRPVNGAVKTQGIHGYNGVDLAASAGTPIMAAAGGSVIVSKSSGWNGGYGNYVVIRHDNGTQTLYAHLSSNIAAVGQKVVQGQVIGYIGSTGKSTGIHLHFEVRGARNPF